ncbi:MAG: methionyl-tRNA formyltransferase [Clostridiales bacterium]|nr:methionyl-tRNA formyltransferase [Clostridiales bacterium]
MKAIFMGTPDFSVPVLDAMVEKGIEVTSVVTQPDRPKGRGKGVVYSPVKEAAIRHQLPVLQPEKVREESFVQILRDQKPDVIVVVAFGQILTKSVLDVPVYGCVNVHASLLPMYRGAAPIQYAVLDGLKETGITTMMMDEGLDTGDMLLQCKVSIDDEETGGSLFDKLSEAGAKLLIETLDCLEQGRITPTPQTGETCYVGMIKKSMGEINWTKSAVELERLVRGMNPWPSAFTKRQGKGLKIWSAVVKEGHEGCPGEVVSVERDGFGIQTGEGVLWLREVQPEGKRRMTAAEYLRGYPVECGEILGE